MTNNTAPLILVVDDEAGFLEIMQAKLESQGFRVIVASNGNEALEKAKRFNPSVVLMDVEMPEKDGLTAASELANNPATSKIPTIFVTNLTQKTAEHLAERVSIHLNERNYFRKDGDYNFLIQDIKEILTF